MDAQLTCVACQKRTASLSIGQAPRCSICALRYRPLLRRSALTALVVGSVLTAINQGSVLLAGGFPAALAWKIPLTYCVPFCVSIWGALVNSRLPQSNDGAG